MRNPRFIFSATPIVMMATVFATSGCSKPNDSQVAAQVKSQLAADSALQGESISVAANHGVVTLSGSVTGQGSRELAGNDAARVKGVSTVLNNLTVGSPSASSNQSNGPDNSERASQPPRTSNNAMMDGRPIQSYSDSAPTPPPASMQSAPPLQQQSFVIPSGTRIRVELAQTLSTKQSQTGDPFSGTVASPVQVNGQTVIPARSAASGTVIEAKSQGRFTGQAILAVRLDSVRVNGRIYPVQTSRVERFEKGKGKRSAIMTGGGAGLGALIGGLAGGGKGALIGGLLGGGGGAAGSAFTGNRDLVLPAESVLTFNLDHNVTIR